MVASSEVAIHTYDRLRARQAPSWFAILFIGAAISVPILLAVQMFLPNFLFLFFAMLGLFIGVFPLLVQKNRDPFSIWNTTVLLNISIGVTLQGICLTFDWPNDWLIHRLHTLGHPPIYFLRGAFILMIGLTALAVGYLFLAPSLDDKTRNTAGQDEWDRRRLYIVIAVCVVISVVAFAIFISRTGGLDLTRLSAKRTRISYGLEFDLRTYNGYGYIRMLCFLSHVAYYLYLGHIAFDKIKLDSLRISILTLLFINAAALPFYSSSRMTILWLIACTVMIWHYSGRAIKSRNLIILGFIAFVIFQVVTVARTQTRGKVDSSIIEYIKLDKAIEPIALSRHVLGISKTTHVIEHIPQSLDFQFGKTLVTWLYAPMPREFWPSKPIILSGPIIGTSVFGTTGSGVPPGIVAELYWNFHIPGVLIGCALIGWFFRRIYEGLRPYAAQHRNAVIVYVTIVIPFGVTLLMAGVSYAIVSKLPMLVLVLAAMSFVKSKNKDLSLQSVKNKYRRIPRKAFLT